MFIKHTTHAAPDWLRTLSTRLFGWPRRHSYRLLIRCQDRADMERVMAEVEALLLPAGLNPSQAMLGLGRAGTSRELVLSLACTPAERRHLVRFVNRVGLDHGVRWILHPTAQESRAAKAARGRQTCQPLPARPARKEQVGHGAARSSAEG